MLWRRWERNGSIFQSDVRLDDFGTPSTIRCAMRSIRPSIGIPKRTEIVLSCGLQESLGRGEVSAEEKSRLNISFNITYKASTLYPYFVAFSVACLLLYEIFVDNNLTLCCIDIQ